MTKVLTVRGYNYQYLFCRNAGHGIGNAQAQFLPHAIEWVSRGHTAKKVGWPEIRSSRARNSWQPTTALSRHEGNTTVAP